jgi:integrase/recombinase XerD
MKTYLKNLGLMPSTQELYLRIYVNVDKEDPIKWLQKEIAQRQPVGTLLPKRAIVKHILINEMGMLEDEVLDALPKLRGKRASLRQALTGEQLKEYLYLSNQVTEPSRTIMILLPYTGLRISEICSLTHDNLIMVGDRLVLKFRGKGDKQRLVPLSDEAKKHFDSFLKKNRNRTGHIFKTIHGHIKPASVRKNCRKIAQKAVSFEHVSPHVLRHTFASNADRRGVSLKQLQALMGHQQITTTSRYLHPTIEDLIGAVDKI